MPKFEDLSNPDKLSVINAKLDKLIEASADANTKLDKLAETVAEEVENFEDRVSELDEKLDNLSRPGGDYSIDEI